MRLDERERNYLDRLQDSLRHIRGKLAVDPGSITPFSDDDLIAQRALQVAIQCYLDLGDSLLAKAGRPEPGRQRDISSALAGAGIIANSDAQPLEELADFRNDLVRVYLDLTPVRTWETRSNIACIGNLRSKTSSASTARIFRRRCEANP